MFLAWDFGTTEEFESGQSLQAVEEVGGEAGERFVLALGDDLCAFADHDHEEGNQRGGDKQNNAREQVHWEDENEDTDRGTSAVMTSWGRY